MSIDSESAPNFGSAAAVVSLPSGADADAPPSAPLLAAPILRALRETLASEFEVEQEIGRGGMSVVFRATERALGRRVALKVLPPELVRDDQTAERFLREARLTAALDHPNVMPIYRVGSAAGMSYFTMKLVEGRSVDDIIAAQGPLAVGVVWQLLRAAASALAFAHERRIVHRDVKGGNVLVGTDGRVLVTDFGIARALEEAALSSGSTVVGTPSFMSPEQCAGAPIGPQSDQYSLGVLAFQMLIGRLPFEGDNFAAILQHHFFTPPPKVAELRGDVPRGLSAIVDRLLAKKPDDRFAHTADLLDAIDALPITAAERQAGAAALPALARGDAVSRLAPGVVAPPRALPTLPPVAKDFVAQLAASQAARRAGALSSLPNFDAAAALQAARDAVSRWSEALGRHAEEAGRLVERQGWRVRMRAWVPAIALALLVLIGLTATLAATRRSPASQLRRGIALYDNGEHEAARALFASIALERPQLATPHLYLGRLAHERGDFRAARRELRTAVELAPDDPVPQRELGALLLMSGQYELALRFYVRALRLDPSDRLSQGYLGCALARLGRTQEAVRFLERAGPGGWWACAGR
jgi:tetratricopeptide (TPR) repeat protein/predicted Ser/Thr protein kinase